MLMPEKHFDQHVFFYVSPSHFSIMDNQHSGISVNRVPLVTDHALRYRPLDTPLNLSYQSVSFLPVLLLFFPQ
jgi:hypothetical protein